MCIEKPLLSYTRREIKFIFNSKVSGVHRFNKLYDLLLFIDQDRLIRTLQLEIYEN